MRAASSGTFMKGLSLAIDMLQAKKRPPEWAITSGDNGLHPIADSVNQLSVASFEIVFLQRFTEANKPAP